ncbi:unnamed protein product, partial [Laminaria digitata]
GQYQAGVTRRDPIGRRYAVRREDVLNQFPHQYSPFLALPGGLGETIGAGLASGRGFDGTVFRMSLRTRPGDISGSLCTSGGVERELKRFSESASAGLVMAHYLGSVHASVVRSGTGEVDQLFSCRVPRRRDRVKRREAVTDSEWRKTGLNVMFRGYVAPRGTYKLTVCSSTVKEKWADDGGGGGGGGGRGSS